MPAGLLGPLRAAALIVVAAGAFGSLGFMLDAGRRSPRFLVVIFVFWVLAPFAALGWAGIVSTRWSAASRTTLYIVMLVVALGSLAIYSNDGFRPRDAPAAFLFVLVPPVSFVIAMAVPIAVWISGRRSR